MAFFTNYSSSPLDGVLIPAGGEYHVVLRQIFEAILSESNGNWAEVTDSSPTPEHIREFASNVPSGVDNSSAPSTSDQVTMYHTNDPDIGSGYARLIRIHLQQLSSIDPYRTYIMEPYVNKNVWTDLSLNDLAEIIQSNSMSIGTLFSGTASTSTFNFDHRILVFGDDDFLLVVSYNTAQPAVAGAMYFYYPETVPGFSRQYMPYFFGINVPPQGLGTTIDNSWPYAGSFRPADSFVNSGSNDLTLITHDGEKDLIKMSSDFKFSFPRVSLYNNRTFFSLVGTLPRIRVCHESLIPATFFDFEAGGRNWLCFMKSPRWAWCIDVTP